jgi:hypothetical protein
MQRHTEPSRCAFDITTRKRALASARPRASAARNEHRRRNRRERSDGHERLAKLAAPPSVEAAGDQKSDAEAKGGAGGDDESEFWLAQDKVAHNDPPHGNIANAVRRLKRANRATQHVARCDL